MWPRVLSACIPSALILSSVALAQTTQDHPPDHRLQLVGARQLAVKPFSTLPKGVLFLRVENFSTTEAAHDLAVEPSWQRLDPFLPFLRPLGMCSMSTPLNSAPT
jgi:hypothetical protein